MAPQEEQEGSAVLLNSGAVGKPLAQHLRAALLKSLRAYPKSLFCLAVLGLGAVVLLGCSSSCLSKDGLNGEGRLLPAVCFFSRLSVNSTGLLSRAREQGTGNRLCPQAPQEGAPRSHCPEPLLLLQGILAASGTELPLSLQPEDRQQGLWDHPAPKGNIQSSSNTNAGVTGLFMVSAPTWCIPGDRMQNGFPWV